MKMSYCKFLFCCCIGVAMGCGKTSTSTGSQPLPPPTVDTSYDLRILTYNIHHASPPASSGIYIDSIAQVIKKQQPDLVAIQEVDVYTNRSGKTLHEAAEIARQLGFSYFFAKAIDYDGGEYGIAVLSRFPIASTTNNPLPTAAGTGGELRTLAIAMISLPGSKTIAFAATHLDAQTAETNRLLQMQKITDILKQQTVPVILAGDFNAIPGSNTINILDGAFTRSCISGCGFTIPALAATKTIDFIAYRPADKFTITQHTVIDEKYASDHLPVLAVIKIK